MIVSKLLFYLEQTYYDEFLVKSPLLDLPEGEYHKWLLLFILGGHDSNIFPISDYGKFVVTGSIYLGWATIGFTVFYTILNDLMRKKRKAGMSQVKWKNHFVICGWNDRGPKLIKDTVTAMKEFMSHAEGESRKSKIVVVHPNIQEVIEKDEKLNDMEEKGKLRYINGEPKYSETLKQANIHKARTVILLSDDGSKSSDERSLLRAMAISRHCHRMQTEENGEQGMKDRIYIIAEINNAELKESFYDNDVNEVVCTSEIGNGIIVQSTINHGISKVLDDLLAYNDENEFYMIDLRMKKFAKYRDKSFQTIQRELHEQNVMLLGIKATYYNDEGDEIIDRNQIEGLLNSGEGDVDVNKDLKLKRQLMINPVGSEKRYKTDKDDQLLVLAKSGKVINQL